MGDQNKAAAPGESVPRYVFAGGCPFISAFHFPNRIMQIPISTGWWSI